MNPTVKRTVENPRILAAAGTVLVTAPLLVRSLRWIVSGGIREQGRDAIDDVKHQIDHAEDSVQDLAEDAVESIEGLGRDLLPNGKVDQIAPVNASIDVAVPIEVAYGAWSKFEEWPEFMSAIEGVEQIDPTTVSMSTRVWGQSREFEARIEEQEPDRRIEWQTRSGTRHNGVVTFHKLARNLTRIEVTLEVGPRGLIERAGHLFGLDERAIKDDLRRFKAHVELLHEPPEGWRGTIEEGKVKGNSAKSGKKAKSAGGHGSAAGKSKKREAGRVEGAGK